MPGDISSLGFIRVAQKLTGLGEMYMLRASTPLERVVITNERKDNMGVYRKWIAVCTYFCTSPPSETKLVTLKAC